MTAFKPVCSNCGQPLPSEEAICTYCSNELNEPTQSPSLPRFVYGFLFSLPVLLVAGVANTVADSINNELGLLLIGLALLVSLPWSIIGIIMMLSTLPNGNNAIALAAAAVIIGGAHLNGMFLFCRKSSSGSSGKVRRYDQRK